MLPEGRRVPLVAFVDDEQGCDWSGLRERAEAAREVVGTFCRAPRTASDPSMPALAAVDPVTRREIIQAAAVMGCPPHDVLAANAFYDSSRGALGCTAFALDAPGGPVHGHCLDWEVGSEVLSRHLTLVDFVDPSERTTLRSVGWPGFLGVYVGVSPGRFALTMNAVWSEAGPRAADPLGFVLRRAMTACTRFGELVDRLASAPLMCDCLLLLTGARQGEMALIERTPGRSVVCERSSSILLATNHYCVLEEGASRPGYVPTGREPFGTGTRERYDAALLRLMGAQVGDVDSCFSLLGGPPFIHETTVLRTAMRASSGQLTFSPVFPGPTEGLPGTESRCAAGEA